MGWHARRLLGAAPFVVEPHGASEALSVMLRSKGRVESLADYEWSFCAVLRSAAISRSAGYAARRLGATLEELREGMYRCLAEHPHAAVLDAVTPEIDRLLWGDPRPHRVPAPPRRHSVASDCRSPRRVR